MKKLGKFFKLIGSLLIAVPVIILIFAVIIFGFIFAGLEVFFRCGRVGAVAFLRGVAESHREKKKVETVMQTNMKSKRTH